MPKSETFQHAYEMAVKYLVNHPEGPVDVSAVIWDHPPFGNYKEARQAIYEAAIAANRAVMIHSVTASPA